MKGLVIYTYVIFGLMFIYLFSNFTSEYLWGVVMLSPMLAMAILWHVRDAKSKRANKDYPY